MHDLFEELKRLVWLGHKVCMSDFQEIRLEISWGRAFNTMLRNLDLVPQSGGGPTKVAAQGTSMILILRAITLLSVYQMDHRETGGRERRQEDLQESGGRGRDDESFKKVAVGWKEWEDRRQKWLHLIIAQFWGEEGEGGSVKWQKVSSFGL